MIVEYQNEPCTHPDFDWFNPDLNSDDPMDEILACTECGYVRYTARQIEMSKEVAERLTAKRRKAMSKPTVCAYCQKVIKRDIGSVTGWRHSSSGKIECEPK